MGKIYVEHRIVVRDQVDKIVSDLPARDMASAQPIYDEAVDALLGGQTVTLQHGARIICKSD
ncbi:MAG: hypothetical protein JKY94_04360 [Rhodobacteraceae bacterium]|nr:hypothetical protein [Paracoccaceae bacterium]